MKASLSPIQFQQFYSLSSPKQNEEKPVYPLDKLYIISTKYYLKVYEMITTGVSNSKAITKSLSDK